MLFGDNIDLRDLFEWSGAARTNTFPLPQPPVPDALDLRGRLNSLLGDFCPSLGCIDFYCSVHNSTPSAYTPQEKADDGRS